MKIRYFSINFITLRTIKAYSHIILDILGRFSKDNAKSNENVKVRRKALTALTALSLPLFHWSICFSDLCAPSSLTLCLCYLYS